MIRLSATAVSVLITAPGWAQASDTGAPDLIWDTPVVYAVTIGGPPTWPIEVSAAFPTVPDSLSTSGWSSFAFPEGWSALVRDAVAVQGGVPHALERGAEGTWIPGELATNLPLTVRYSVDLAPVFAAYESLPKTTAPWTDGQSLVIPGFSLFMHSTQQGPFVVQFKTHDGARVDTGWSSDAEDGRFRGSSLDELLQNTFVVGHHQAAEVTADGLRIKAVPLGRHRAGIDRLAPIVESHARRFRSLFEYPTDQPYLIVLIDDPWDTGESFPDSFAMAYSTPIQEYNQAAWGKTIAHELFHYWNGGGMRAADWATSQWFSEGVTDYIATRAMIDGGFITTDELFDEMQKHVSFYALFKQGIVYDDLSLVEAGSHKTTHNAAVYDGGWLVAFCIDIIIRDHTSNAATIETMMRRLWDKHAAPVGGTPYSNEDVISVGEAIGGPEVRQLFDRYVAGKDHIPLDDFFRRAGLRLVVDAQLTWVRPLADAPAGARRIREGLAGVSP